MNDAPPRFGFEGRAGQLSYPFLVSAMLLAHSYLYPEFPGLRTAEFYLSMAGLALYIASRKFLIGPREIRLSTTPNHADLDALALGDIVYLDRLIYTAREGV